MEVTQHSPQSEGERLQGMLEALDPTDPGVDRKRRTLERYLAIWRSDPEAFDLCTAHEQLWREDYEGPARAALTADPPVVWHLKHSALMVGHVNTELARECHEAALHAAPTDLAHIKAYADFARTRLHDYELAESLMNLHEG